MVIIDEPWAKCEECGSSDWKIVVENGEKKKILLHKETCSKYNKKYSKVKRSNEIYGVNLK
ncbi:MAG: hypothetical protein PWQ59_459 [Thermoanaerobacterium sp.]|nr:hypothetical protein [Thermoanaerobacterium sp.]